MVRLVQLDPHWMANAGRHGMGLSFRCPVHVGTSCTFERIFVAFANPLDGEQPFEDRGSKWQREGDDFATLTLSPSIHAFNRDRTTHFHGFITRGEVT